MIDQIQVKNFKSLADVSLLLGNFTCLIGMNGAGKSTLLRKARHLPWFGGAITRTNKLVTESWRPRG